MQIKTLNHVLKPGLKCKKIYRVIEFQQSKWMKAYIMLNTRLRAAANNEFEKGFFKLTNNNVFEMTMKLVTSEVSEVPLETCIRVYFVNPSNIFPKS